MTGHQTALSVRAWLQTRIPASWREGWYRVASGLVMFLFAFGLLTADAVTLWIQMAVATVTLLFALLYATSAWRVALYAIVAPVGSVLLFYGVVDDVRWAVISAAVAQIFGITTAAAKTVTIDTGGHAVGPTLR